MKGSNEHYRRWLQLLFEHDKAKVNWLSLLLQIQNGEFVEELDCTLRIMHSLQFIYHSDVAVFDRR